MKPLNTKHKTVFQFAGFSFPRYVGILPRGGIEKRKARYKTPVCGNYQTAPVPDSCGSAFFYLDSDFMPGMRWKWCDDITRIDHTGWYCDKYQDQKIRGIVFRLPGNRGFLAGWSMGEGMASFVDTSEIFTGERDAAYCADSMAENAAEREREYQAQQEQNDDENGEMV